MGSCEQVIWRLKRLEPMKRDIKELPSRIQMESRAEIRNSMMLEMEADQMEIRQLETSLGTLSKEEQITLYEFYIHRRLGYLERLCLEFDLSKSSVYRLKETALLNLARTLYGVVRS